MGANRPLAGRRSVAVLTVHGTLRAAGSAPPPPTQSHPRSGRRIPGSRPRSVGRGQNCSGRRAVGLGRGGERACSLPRLPARRSLLLLELSPIHVPGTHSKPRLCSDSGRPGKRESLPAPGAGASNKPVSTPTLLRQRGSQSTDRE